MKGTFTSGSLIVELGKDDVLLLRRFNGHPKKLELTVGSIFDETEVIIDEEVICDLGTVYADRFRKRKI
jgi:hypothetical protein